MAPISTLHSIHEDLIFRSIYADLSDPNVEGVYETQVPLLFRAFLRTGCVCRVLPGRRVASADTFHVDELEMASVSCRSYLQRGSVKYLYMYQHRASSGPRQIIALFLAPIKKAVIVVVDTVRTNLMPNLTALYQTERTAK